MLTDVEHRCELVLVEFCQEYNYHLSGSHYILFHIGEIVQMHIEHAGVLVLAGIVKVHKNGQS